MLFCTKLGHMAGAFSKWGNDTFGKIPKKIKSLHWEIELLNKDLSTHSAWIRVRELEIEKDRLYSHEEYY